MYQDKEETFEYESCYKQPSSCVLKPNYTLSFEDKEEERVDIFAIEVKAPKRNRNSNDFIKHCINSPHVVGLLIDGMLDKQKPYLLY
ncbi:hypothetical protein A0J61_08480 [Choanephora cucurbitarum]|uniref:Uncharacterized protein n=1 Tax=Choanephora cucurbitarum TaxID=101091 RepID=A0A1C7N2W8_9FUNG|nr:hypothetical protein A0J61_08480 [Choanephora cucurbitarum]